MSEILLATKLYIPPWRGNLVNRPHLIQRLNDGIAHNDRLTLISAPAGYGKSTLLSEWISQVKIPVAWLSLEKGENTPSRFWSYFITALDTIPHLHQADIGASFSRALQSPQPLPMDVLIANLVNEFSQLKEPVLLVLDDLHTITEGQIYQDLVFLIDHLPSSASGLHLVVAGRMDPPWPLARWRVRGELTEVRARDMRFSQKEATTFLNEVMGLKLTARDIDLLDHRTEGWVAGLQMAALSMQGRGDVEGFLEGFSGSHHFILDYLLEEVLSQQKPEVLDFLLKTSILENLTAPLCDTVTESKNSQAMLVLLEKSNMFLVSLDNERHWYRYHHLFAEMLQAHLKQAHSEAIPALHGKACTWYSENGYYPKALTHAIAAGDLDRLARLVEKYAFSILDLNEASTFLDWLDTLPDHVKDSYPWLNIARAWLLAYLGQTKGIEQAIFKAENSSDGTNHRLLGYIAAIRTLLAELYLDPAEGIRQAHRAYELLPQGEYRPRAFVSYHLSNLLAWQGDALAASKAIEDASAWSIAAGDSEMAMISLIEKANILHHLGRLTESLHMFEKTIQMAESGYPDKKNRSLAIGYAYLQMSVLVLEWNKLSEALKYAREGTQICRLWGYSDYLYNGSMHLATILLADGDLDGALSTVREAKQLFNKNQPVIARLGALEAVINLARGDLQSASAWATHSGLQLSDTLDIGHWTEYYHFSTILIAQGKLQEAYDILEHLGYIMEKTNSLTPLLKTLAQRIIILHLMKEDEKALSLLQHVLGLAEPEGFIRVFISKGAPMEQMLLKAAKAGLYTDFVNRLLRNFHEKSSTTTIAGIHPEINASGKKIDHPTIEPLTNQELKVLRLLNTHLSIPEIAQEMFVSPSTIRSHVRNIYEKVGVHGRIEALEQAKELGLL